MDGVFVFGPYRLYPTARILQRDGAPVSIGSRAFDVLVALVQRSGQVVSRRELMTLAWPGLFVDDSNVRVQMANLRRELGSVDGSRYIVGVPGRGYCFVSPVHWLKQSGEIDASSGDLLVAYDGKAIPNDGRSVGLHHEGRRLPAPLERAFGRDDDVLNLSKTLAARRFVTVVGPGGIGKTTLAVLVAHAMETLSQQTYFVDLSTVAHSHSVMEAVASAMGLQPTQDPLEDLLGFLANKRVVIILDNCEHVINGAADVIVPILKHAPDAHILVTSREALRLTGEALYLLRPLSAPPHTGRLTASQALAWPAVALFMERAAEGGYDQALSDEQAPTVAAICRRLDGNPLAIELVATRVATYGFSRVAELLTNQLALHWRWRRDAAPRHQTVEAMLDWSHDLLCPRDRMVFYRLSVFVSRFSLEAAEAIATDERITAAEVAEAIGNLVDKSLIAFHATDRLAHLSYLDTTKTYAAMKLVASGDEPACKQRHAQYFLRQLRQHASDAEQALASNLGMLPGFDVGNVRVALEWAFSEEGDKELAAEICGLAVPALLDVLTSARKRVLRNDEPRAGQGDAYQQYPSVAIRGD